MCEGKKIVAVNRPTKLGSGNSNRDNSRANFRADSRPNSRADSRSNPKFTKKSFAYKPAFKFLGICLHLAIIGVGLSVITGTSIAFFGQPISKATPEIIPTETQNRQSEPAKTELTKIEAAKTEPAKTELTALTAKVVALTKTEPTINVEMFLTDLDSNGYVDINASKAIAAASMIKIPVLVAFLQDVDAGKIRLDEPLIISKDVIVGHSGNLQYEKVGTKISALDTITLMIIISDNTATNMIIKRLGGKEIVNQRFADLELTSTVIRNPLPDLTGTNTTSPQDLVNLLAMIEQGKILTPRSRDRLMDIMHRTKTNTLLPQGIPATAKIFHKTGDIQSVVGDTGIIDTPDGKRYIISVIAKRPTNDQKANELIRKISRTVYNHLQNAKIPANSALDGA